MDSNGFRIVAFQLCIWASLSVASTLGRAFGSNSDNNISRFSSRASFRKTKERKRSTSFRNKSVKIKFFFIVLRIKKSRQNSSGRIVSFAKVTYFMCHFEK
jgi:hypothetical protein